MTSVHPFFCCCHCAMLTFEAITANCRNPIFHKHCFHTITFKKSKLITAEFRNQKEIIQKQCQKMHKKVRQ